MATLTFTHDIDSINVHHHTEFGDPKTNGSLYEFFSSNFGLVTTDGRKVTHISPLKKIEKVGLV